MTVVGVDLSLTRTGLANEHGVPEVRALDGRRRNAYKDPDRFGRNDSYLTKPEPVDVPTAALDVAQRHGLLVAATWAGVPVSRVLAWRTARGGTAASDTDPAVDLHCPCQRCLGERSRAMVASNMAHAGSQPNFKLTPEPWMARAACAGADTNLFFPERGESTSEAKAICASCPVAGDCLDYALRTNQRHGIWGGTSERDRRRSRRAEARRATKAAAEANSNRHDVA